MSKVRADALEVGMYLDSRSRVAAIHQHNGKILVKSTVKGARSATVHTYEPAALVNVKEKR